MSQSLNFSVRPIFNLGPGWTTIRSLSLSKNADENPGLVFYNKNDFLMQYSVSTPKDPKFPQSIEVPPFSVGGQEGFTAVLPVFINESDPLEGLLFYAAGSGDAKYFRANSIQALPQLPVHIFAAEDNFGPGFTTVVALDLEIGARVISDELSYNATTGEAFYSQDAGALVPGDNPQVNMVPENFGPGWNIVMNAVVFSNVQGVPNQSDRLGLLLYNSSTGEARVLFASDGATFTQSRSGNIGTGWTSIAPILVGGEPTLLLYKAATGDAAVTNIPIIQE
jgi:hypothetical protein